MPDFQCPVLGFAAFSGTGKTTLLKKLLPILRRKGLNLAVVKHAHHQFDVDKPGKDSYELRKAGASPMLISSSRRMAMMLDFESEAEPELNDMIDYLPLHRLNGVLVEGFKQTAFSKIELHRPALDKPLLCLDDGNIIALATDDVTGLPDCVESVDRQQAIRFRRQNEWITLPLLDLNCPEQLAEFVARQIARQAGSISDKRNLTAVLNEA